MEKKRVETQIKAESEREHWNKKKKLLESRIKDAEGKKGSLLFEFEKEK